MWMVGPRVFMNGRGAGPWTAAACAAVAREARSAASRWTGGTRGDQANTFEHPPPRGPRRRPRRTLEALGRLWAKQT